MKKLTQVRQANTLVKPNKPQNKISQLNTRKNLTKQIRDEQTCEITNNINTNNNC